MEEGKEEKIVSSDAKENRIFSLQGFLLVLTRITNVLVEQTIK